MRILREVVSASVVVAGGVIISMSRCQKEERDGFESEREDVSGRGRSKLIVFGFQKLAVFVKILAISAP